MGDLSIGAAERPLPPEDDVTVVLHKAGDEERDAERRTRDRDGGGDAEEPGREGSPEDRLCPRASCLTGEPSSPPRGTGAGKLRRGCGKRRAGTGRPAPRVRKRLMRATGAGGTTG